MYRRNCLYFIQNSPAQTRAYLRFAYYHLYFLQMLRSNGYREDIGNINQKSILTLYNKRIPDELQQFPNSLPPIISK